MTLGEYINNRVSTGETFVGIEGTRSGVDCDLIRAARYVPDKDWDAEIRDRQRDGRNLLIWISGNAEPDYIIVKTD